MIQPRTSVLKRRNPLFKAVIGTATVVVVLAATPACTPKSSKSSSSSKSTSGKSGGTIVWAKPQDVVSTDPATDGGGNATDWEIYNEVYNGLVSVDSSGKAQPALATAWTQPSPTKYVFTLRQGVKFSNGRLMTVQDVVATLQRIMSPKVGSNWASQLGMSGIAPLGATQVEITLSAPSSAFLAALASPQVSILPMKEFAAKSFDPAKSLLGTGPYMIKSHIQGQSWAMVRNPYYWGTPAKADALKINVITDDSARVAALHAGSADITTFDSPDAVALLKGQPNITTVVHDANLHYRLDVNAKSSLFSDPRLRQALSLSIDRSKIVQALGGTGVPTAAIGPAFNACNPDSMPYSKPDLAQAKALVAAAGATGKTVSIIATTAYSSTFVPIAEVLQQGLQAAGLKVKILQIDIGTWVKRAFSGAPSNFDLAVAFSAEFADPSMLFTNYNPILSKYNLGYTVDDPALDSLIAQVGATPAGAARSQLIEQACTTIAKSGNVIPLVTKPIIIAYRSDKINVNIDTRDPYDVPLKNIAQYSLR